MFFCFVLVSSKTKTFSRRTRSHFKDGRNTFVEHSWSQSSISATVKETHKRKRDAEEKRQKNASVSASRRSRRSHSIPEKPLTKEKMNEHVVTLKAFFPEETDNKIQTVIRDHNYDLNQAAEYFFNRRRNK